jgi:hypothetical protein
MAGGLSKALNAPGGIDLTQACERAALHLEALKERALGELRACLNDIAALCALGAPAPEMRREMHRLSCSLAGMGGMFGYEGLSKAAYCFCRLLDETAPGWNGQAAQVHVASMQLLLSGKAGDAGQEAALLEGLEQIPFSWAHIRRR